MCITTLSKKLMLENSFFGIAPCDMGQSLFFYIRVRNSYVVCTFLYSKIIGLP